MAHPLAEISNFNYDALNKELELTAEEKDNLDTLLKAYLDDFWQGGVGTLLPTVGGKYTKNLNAVLEKRFVFRNVIKEVVGRVAGAFYGKAPNWKYQQNGVDLINPNQLTSVELEKAKKDQQALLDDAFLEIDKALGDFWTRQNVSDQLGKAFQSRLAFGRGSWRLYIPTKYKRKNATTAAGNEPNVDNETNPENEGVSEAEAGEFVQFPSIAEAIKAMRIEFIPPTQGRLLDDGGELFSIVKYQVRRDWSTRDTVNVIEFSFVDNSDRTFIGTVDEKSGISKITDANLSSPFDFAGLTTLGEFRGMPYVTKALYKNNQLVNLALTCAGFSLVDNGFGEMVLTNVELETKKVMGPDGTEIDVPTDIKRGGGAVQNFVGIETVDESTGSVRRESPGVTFREPTAVTTFKDGYDLGYVACLQEAGQLYALISGDATASGESRIQALADFLLKIGPYKSEVDEQGGWLLTVVRLWAAQLANQQLAGYGVVYDSRVHVANLSDTEKQSVMNMRKDGVISRETERVLLGIDVPALENELVLREQAAPPQETTVEQLSEKADLALKLIGLSVDQETIYKILGFTDQQILEIKQRAADEQAALQESIRLANEAAGGGGTGGPGTGQGAGAGSGAAAGA